MTNREKLHKEYQMKLAIDSITHHIDYVNFAAICAQSDKLNREQVSNGSIGGRHTLE